jgi:peptide deformylase
MAKLKIRVYRDPVLKRKARPVKKISRTVKKLVEDMFETMYSNNGIGLAAPQVGESKRVFVIDTKEVGERIAAINPKIIPVSGKDTEKSTEGCLSLPEMEVEVERPRRVILEYLDTEGHEMRLEAEGLLARAIQHEYDHLEGHLIIDRAISRQKKEELLQEMAELEQEAYV